MPLHVTAYGVTYEATLEVTEQDDHRGAEIHLVRGEAIAGGPGINVGRRDAVCKIKLGSPFALQVAPNPNTAETELKQSGGVMTVQNPWV